MNELREKIKNCGNFYRTLEEEWGKDLAENNLDELLTLYTQSLKEEREKAVRGLKKSFEANLLDGDTVEDCGNAMLSASEVYSFLEEYLINKDTLTQGEGKEKE